MKKILLYLLLFNVETFAQINKFIKTEKNDCLVFDENYSPEDVATWSGGCKNNYIEGQGTLLWKVNNQLVAKYEGEIKKGKYNGIGKLVINEWATMQGNFVNGSLNGQGIIKFVDGGILKGNFVNGSLLELDKNYLKLLKKNILNIKDTENIYINDGENGDSLYCYVMIPKTKIKGVLVLLPSTGESAENVVSCNKKIIQLAYNKGILSVVPSINYNKGIEVDKFSMNFLDTLFIDIIEKYKTPANKFILSGLSLGGNNALLYTELSRNNEYKTAIKPLAVIGIDPPVDYAGLYHKAKYEIALYAKDSLTPSKKMALNEDNFLIEYYHELYGGTPEKFPEKYSKGSQFSLNQADGGNAKYLIDVPVRIYSDPDIVWQLKNKSRSYYQMNAPDQSAMINFLMIKGNKKAEFIQALGKGYRLEGVRHPHSWSIVDADECIKWILSLVK